VSNKDSGWITKVWALAALACARVALGATDWSTQDYNLYAGDFNGDGKTDLLYIAKDPSKVSGIMRSSVGVRVVAARPRTYKI
jgi:hypothetical protein